MENQILENYKTKIYNDIIVTSRDKVAADAVEDFIIKVVGYKPNAGIILHFKNDEKYLCPIMYVFQAFLHFDVHSFKINEKVSFYLEQANKVKSIIEEQGGKLESWEEYWIELITALSMRNKKKAIEICLEAGKNNPNDILAFKIGMVIALHSGDKQFMKTLGELYSSYENNHKDGNFIGVYSFVLEELRMFEESEKWVLKGLEIAPNNVWIQHVYSHILYQTDRVEDSIEYLEKNKTTWRENGNNFIYKHIYWHLAIAYLECENYEQANSIINYIMNYHFEDAECPLAILGYLSRAFIRSGGDIQKIIPQELLNLCTEKIVLYLQNLKIYTRHLLFDVLSIWFLSYLKNTNTTCEIDLEKLIENILQTIQNNINSEELNLLDEEDKNYLTNTYSILFSAMIYFSKGEYKESLNILQNNEKMLWKIGASDEQLFILFEMELFCALKTGDSEIVENLISNIFGENLKKLPFIQKLIN